MPYSVSVLMTRSTLIVLQRSAGRHHRLPARRRRRVPAQLRSKVLTGVGDRVDGAARLGALLAGDQSADVDDALALLAGDARPVVGVGGVGQVLVLAELVHAGREEMRDPDALLAGLEELLDGHLLGAGHDVLDHGTGVEVL